MEWYLILTLIGIGLLLLVIEVIFIPGTSVAGLIGFALILIGVVLSFNYFGSSTGWIVVGCAAVVSGIIFYWTFRTKPWKIFALKSSIQSKVNEGALDALIIGMTGVTTSALRPMGNGKFGEKIFEVTSLSAYINSGTPIKIVRISSNQILVEPLN